MQKQKELFINIRICWGYKMGKYDNEGMRYPSIDKLVTITHSKYKLVVGAAKRAKALERKDNPEQVLIDNPRSKKPIGVALEEVLARKIEIVDAN